MKDPLASLEVIERLTIGAARVEPRRVTTTYSVTTTGKTETIDLIYRYEEDVFEPGDPISQNLADMITAQVALNYGLFCGEIVFDGTFDRHDRRFLETYLAHTAREILVHKLLLPNPFLVKGFEIAPLEERRSYTRASVRFQGDEPSARDVATAEWPSDPSRPAVLASGGKDSLLSHGMLGEIGTSPRSIFVNESGRHWLTAVNAYRYFAEHVPGTGRVWTTSDRVFNWMLRHLPFIRQDFDRIRSDEYPIRLWTVAVFLFGVLPLLRKHRCGRLFVGDEFDTSLSGTHAGITHYHGLYDQSRWFDLAISRYMHRKHWNVLVASLLRHCSELLIIKTLIERYPDLQAHQVSCHAAHTEGDRVHPCGRCEKCRRIVAIVVAVGGDPARCGYTPEQVTRCLGALDGQGVHQPAPDVQHLFHLLKERGHSLPANKAKPKPRVMALRFDAERAPIETMPTDLRSPILRILLEHANGALERRGRVFVPFDPLRSDRATRPHPLERARARHAPAGTTVDDGTTTGNHLWGELSWPEAKRRLSEVDVALLPVGAIEQHGHHLPLDTDTYDADRLAREVALACTHPKPLVLPIIPYGVSYHHDDFPGTISVGPETLAQMVIEVGMSAARNGVRKLVIVNGHGGNGPALHFAAQVINRDARIFTCVDSGETSDADVSAMIDTPNDVHAGEIETSTSLALRPSLVNLEAAKPDIPKFSSRYLDFSSRRGVGWYARTSHLSKTGTMGDPTKASAEKGAAIWVIIVRNLVELVEDIKPLSLDEIHQRRY